MNGRGSQLGCKLESPTLLALRCPPPAEGRSARGWGADSGGVWKPPGAPGTCSHPLLGPPHPHPARGQREQRVFCPSQHPQHVRGPPPSPPRCQGGAGLWGHAGHGGLGPSLPRGWTQGGRAGGDEAGSVSAK